MLELFEPYWAFIAFILAIGINVLLVFLHGQWWTYLVANVIYVVVIVWIDPTGEYIKPYGFIGEFLSYLWSELMDIIKDIFDKIGDWLNPFWTKLTP